MIDLVVDRAIPLERQSTFTLLGIRFWDPVQDAQVRDGLVVSQWKPDANELALLNQGVPVTLCCYTFKHPLQPVSVAVGGMDLREEAT